MKQTHLILISVDWAPANVFLAQLFQLLGPFLEWRVSGDAFAVQWRDSILHSIAKGRYIENLEVAKKLRHLLLSYFKVTFRFIHFLVQIFGFGRSQYRGITLVKILG